MEQMVMSFVKRKKVIRIGDNAEIWEREPWLENVADDLKASRKSEDTDDLVDVLVYHPIAIRLAHWFIKHGFSANAVTLLSLLFGVGGSIFFYPQNVWINLFGIACELFAVILDFCDGQIARLTHTSSQFGRVLDGTVDITNFLAVYIAIGLRMMREPIPFTEREWGFLIWIVLLVTMLCHASQARMADYYRGLHLYFLKGSSDNADLTRTKKIRQELASLPKGSPFFERIYRLFYFLYTKDQEIHTPWAQRMLDRLEEKGGRIPEETADAYITRSRRYIQLTNVLTFNIRAYALYVCLLLGKLVFYVPLVVVALEAVKWFMSVKYEAIAQNICEREK